ncbi:hypothetical protein HY227_02275 [Candidatus Wolfebacteria bacterium]|nr:hypothetical protein [Candidatus Wolfebacteria bacterium]
MRITKNFSDLVAINLGSVELGEINSGYREFTFPSSAGILLEGREVKITRGPKGSGCVRIVPVGFATGRASSEMVKIKRSKGIKKVDIPHKFLPKGDEPFTLLQILLRKKERRNVLFFELHPSPKQK